MNHFLFIVSFLWLVALQAYPQAYKKGEICLTYKEKNPANRTRLVWHSKEYTFYNADTCLHIFLTKGDKLLIEAEGYQTEIIDLQADRLTNNFSIRVLLKEKSILLKEVTVKRDNRFSYRGDTLVIQTDSVQTRPHSNADELVDKIPGMTMLAGGNIQVFGNTVNQVTVNGKTLFGGDAKATLSALKSDMIKQFEVTKTNNLTNLNIKLKEDKQDGWYGESENKVGLDNYNLFALRINQIKPKQFFNVFGSSNTINEIALSEKDESRLYDKSFNSIEGAYSIIDNTESRFIKEYNRRFELYSSDNYEGKIQTKGGGVNYSNSFKKWDIYGFGLVNRYDQYLHQDKIVTRTTLPYYQSQQSTYYRYTSHDNKQLILSISFRPTNSETFRFYQTITNRQTKDALVSSVNNQFYTNEIQQASNTLKNNTINDGSLFTLAQQAQWIHRFEKPAQVFSLYMSHYYGNESYTQNYLNQLIDTSKILLFNSHNFLNSKSLEKSSQVQASQSVPLSRKFLLEAKLSFLNETYTLSQAAQQLTSSIPIDRKDLSVNPFLVHDKQYSMKTSALYSISNLKVVLGIRVWSWESTVSQNEGNSVLKMATNFRPQAYIQYTSSPSLKVSLLYNQDNKTPTFKNLIPIIDSSNFDHIVYGNAQLRNYIQDNIELNFSTVLKGDHNLNVNFRYRTSNNPIVTVNQYGISGYSSSTFDQLAKSSQADASIVWVKFSRSKSLGFHFINFGGYTNIPMLTNNTLYYFRNYYTLINAGLKLTLKPAIYLKADLQYSSFFSTNNYSSRFQISLSIEKSFTQKTYFRLSNDLIIGQANSSFFTNTPIINFSAYHYFSKNNRIRLGIDGRNLLNIQQLYESKVSINEQLQQFTNRLPRILLLDLTLYLEKWKK